MGVVYKAYHPQLKRTVALKVLIAGEDAPAEAIERFHREAEAVARLGHHPHIVPVYDVGVQGSRHYFAMHYVTGKALDAMIDAGEIGPKRAAAITRQIAQALAHAHSHGILHRDVKPANVILSSPEKNQGSDIQDPKSQISTGVSERQNLPMLTDFGLAKDIQSETKVTRSGVTLGTPHYMPPEQADGRLDDVDERSDIYSLGAALYEMLTAAPPFDGDGIVDVLQKVLSQDPRPPRKLNGLVDPDLETICLKCLEKDPGHRYGSALALAEDLSRYLGGRPIAAKPVSAVGKLVRRARRNRAASTALIVLVLAMAAGGALSLALVPRWAAEKRKAEEATRDEKTARDRADRADRTLEKGHRVVSVLRKAHAELGELSLDISNLGYLRRRSRADPEAEADLWRRVGVFSKTLPNDPPSRAAWLAVEGWLQFLAGRDKEAAASFSEARTADPDVAVGYLFEAMMFLSRYIYDQPLPGVAWESDRVVFTEAHPETEDMKSARREFESILDDLKAGNVHGDTSPDVFIGALEDIRGLQSGDFERAERGLTRAMTLKEMAWMRVDLLTFRAIARYYRKEFSLAKEDMGILHERFPNRILVNDFSGWICSGEALTLIGKGKDGRDSLLEAIGFSETLIRGEHEVRDNRIRVGILLRHLGKNEAKQSRDPCPHFEKSKVVLTDLVLSGKDVWVPLTHRSETAAEYGNFQSSRGGDPREHFHRAIADLERAIRAKPDHLPALKNRLYARVRLGEAELKRGGDAEARFREAVADGAALQKTAPGLPSGRLNHGSAHVWLGRALARKGKDPRGEYREGIRILREALELRGESVMARMNIGEACRLLAEALRARGEDSTPALVEAERTYEEVLRADSEHGGAMAGLGAVCWLQGGAAAERGGSPLKLYEKAMEWLDRAVAQGASGTSAIGVRGVLHLEFGRMGKSSGRDPLASFEEAVADLDRALELSPDDGNARINRAAALKGRGELEAARGKDPMGWYGRGIKDCTTAIEKNPGFAGAHNRRGTLHLAVAKWALATKRIPGEWFDRAVADYTKAIELGPGEAKYSLDRARCHMERAEGREQRRGDPRGSYGEAISDCREALEKRPGYYDALWNLGLALSGRGEAETALGGDPREDFAGAVRAYDLAIRSRPREFVPRHNKAYCLVNLGDWENGKGLDPRETFRKAIAAGDEARDIDDSNPLTHFNLGRACEGLALAEFARGGEGMGPFERSASCFGRTAALNGRLWQAWIKHGKVLENLGRHGAAAKAYEKAHAVVKDGYPPLKTSLNRAIQISGTPPWFQKYAHGVYAWDRHSLAESKALLEKAYGLAHEVGDQDGPEGKKRLPEICFKLACIEAWFASGRRGPLARAEDLSHEERGKHVKAALVWLNRAYETGFSDLSALEKQDYLDPIRKEAEFEALMTRWKSQSSGGD
ncbi:MAG: protein kinase domain-containing protein, partial [Planctomycetota bacterium]|jgi:tetratricopeptide (TPR) repeat protein